MRADAPASGAGTAYLDADDGGCFAPAELARFGEDGYVVVRNLAPAGLRRRLLDRARTDLAAGRAPLEYEADVQYPGAPPTREAPGGRTVRRLLRASERDAAYAEWATFPGVARRLRQLLGPAVALSQAHHNCIMTKNARFSSVTGWHRDVRYWSFERPELVSVWLALGRETRRNGCLMVLPGTHVMAFAPERLDAAQFLRTDLEVNVPLLAGERAVELESGDVLFFDARLFHAAGSNRSAHTKFSVVFTYHAADNRPLAGTRSAASPDILLPD